jgi:hypothetical protein
LAPSAAAAAAAGGAGSAPTASSDRLGAMLCQKPSGTRHTPDTLTWRSAVRGGWVHCCVI